MTTLSSRVDAPPGMSLPRLPRVSLPRTSTLIALLGSHCLLALTAAYFPPVMRFHALGTFAVGLALVLLSSRPKRVAFMCAYIVSCEVLWRMSGAQIPWEFAKYAISLILLIGIFRFFSRRTGLAVPLIYLAALMPSIVIAFQQINSALGVREALSFNLSGPISLALAVMFFRQMTVHKAELTTILWALVIPVAGIATRTLYSIATANKIDFTSESNFQTSGGFGPNQVSAALSLGALAAVLLVSLERRGLLKLAALGAFFWFVAQCFLTFSRGGIYNLAIAGGLALLVSSRGRGRRTAALVLASIVIFVIGLVILPRLDRFTDDRLKPRFASTDTTQRSELATTELEIWQRTPLTGVGPGGLAESRDRVSGDPVAAHTEYTRLLAEHGVGGMIALALLVFMAVRTWRRASSVVAETWAVAFLAWSLVEMGHSAMRIAAIGFCFGLAMISIQKETRGTAMDSPPVASIPGARHLT